MAVKYIRDDETKGHELLDNTWETERRLSKLERLYNMKRSHHQRMHGLDSLRDQSRARAGACGREKPRRIEAFLSEWINPKSGTFNVFLTC